MIEDSDAVDRLIAALDDCDEILNKLIQSAKNGKDVATGIYIDELKCKFDTLAGSLSNYLEDYENV